MFRRPSCEWDSEAETVSGHIKTVHEEDLTYKGHACRASKEEPQYETVSDKTEHIAAHREDAAKKV
ncbi:DUF2945 domain-containing protein [Aurantimonas sp. DM33-3]|uniref:DUF2945 domain-containing protein n=1 Tax=Aurantimonas sp. DM33-3 TaxID=2766955 RepID=UPI0032B26C7C